MINSKRNGEAPRGHQETRIQPSFRLSESLVQRVADWARAYGQDPSSFTEELLRIGLREKMFPSDAGVISGPNGPISVERHQKVNTKPLIDTRV